MNTKSNHMVSEIKMKLELKLGTKTQPNKFDLSCETSYDLLNKVKKHTCV